MKRILLISFLYVSTAFSSEPPSQDNTAIAALQKHLSRSRSETAVAIPRLPGDSPNSFARRIGSAIARLDNPTSISKEPTDTNKG